MSDLLWQGLQISVLGLGLTFFALGLLILTMMVLERLFRPRTPVPESAESVTPAEARQGAETTAESADEEVVAAITAALTYLRAQDGGQSTDLGAELEAGPGAWWQAGRSRHPTIAPRSKQRRNKHESEEKSKGNRK